MRNNAIRSRIVCNPELAQYERIVPCGIADADVTSLTAELGRTVTIHDVVPAVVASLETALAPVRLNSRGDLVTSAATKETV